MREHQLKAFLASVRRARFVDYLDPLGETAQNAFERRLSWARVSQHDPAYADEARFLLENADDLREILRQELVEDDWVEEAEVGGEWGPPPTEVHRNNLSDRDRVTEVWGTDDLSDDPTRGSQPAQPAERSKASRRPPTGRPEPSRPRPSSANWERSRSGRPAPSRTSQPQPRGSGQSAAPRSRGWESSVGTPRVGWDEPDAVATGITRLQDLTEPPPAARGHTPTPTAPTLRAPREATPDAPRRPDPARSPRSQPQRRASTPPPSSMYDEDDSAQPTVLLMQSSVVLDEDGPEEAATVSAVKAVVSEGIPREPTHPGMRSSPSLGRIDPTMASSPSIPMGRSSMDIRASERSTGSGRRPFLLVAVFGILVTSVLAGGGLGAVILVPLLAGSGTWMGRSEPVAPAPVNSWPLPAENTDIAGNEAIDNAIAAAAPLPVPRPAAPAAAPPEPRAVSPVPAAVEPVPAAVEPVPAAVEPVPAAVAPEPVPTATAFPELTPLPPPAPPTPAPEPVVEAPPPAPVVPQPIPPVPAAPEPVAVADADPPPAAPAVGALDVTGLWIGAGDGRSFKLTVRSQSGSDFSGIAELQMEDGTWSTLTITGAIDGAGGVSFYGNETVFTGSVKGMRASGTFTLAPGTSPRSWSVIR